MLILKNITKTYPGVVALDDVSLTVKDGEVHALMGENGAGKSTLIKVIAGAISPDAGEICFDGAQYPRLTPALAREHGVAVIYVLPYATDDASTFTGPSYVTEMSDWQNLEGFTFYYTYNPYYRTQGLGYSSIDFPNEGSWTAWERNPDGIFSIPETPFEPVAIAIVGKVPANQSMKIHITTRQPDATPGARVVNYMRSDNFEDIADSIYVARALSEPHDGD